VGSKHENPDKTGFAHLFEHLMFGGSINIPEYDTPLQFAGGESNAFTSNDITNYYLTLPAPNIETGFWLESDRMLSLDFSQQSLDIQRNVVIEEYKERYLNPPYGDVWLKILPLAYKQHPYSWPTIGKDVAHIENAVLDDVKAFFKNFYCPNNAILVIAGNISLERAKELTEKWFASIPSQPTQKPEYGQEPKQLSPRFEKVEADVPLDLLVKTYHTVSRNHKDYYATDLVSDLLGSGKSARLYDELVKNKRLFSELDCYLTGDIEPGLLIIEGKLSQGVSIEIGEKAIETMLADFYTNGISEQELTKVKNKTETNIRFNDIGVLNKAMKLAYSCLLGDINLVNTEAENYLQVQKEDIIRVASELFQENNCSTLYYLAKK
jgi:predicted Zn-dependent peptidase